MTFKDFGLDISVLDGLEAMGFETPTPVQAQAIPLILQQRDLIACAQTGTGKTAAFVLPILSKLAQEPVRRNIDTLIIAPTRELAIQIDQQIEGLGYFVGVSSISVYGGGGEKNWVLQKQAIVKGADILVATPGRFLAHLKLGYVDLSQVKHFILDEADRMLDMGFLDDIMHVVSHLPGDCQTLMFSATMPDKIRRLARKLLEKPEQISIAISKPAENIQQDAYLTYDHQKIPLLKHILRNDQLKKVIVFGSTKQSVRDISRELQMSKFPAKSIHSDKEQSEREEIIRRFKNNHIQILIATDIISRGIDIDDISLIVNYDVPPDPEDYIHRIGRTARASSSGNAVTFINEYDQYRFSKIERLIEKEIPKLPFPEGLKLGDMAEYNPNANKRLKRRGGHKGGGRGRYKQGGGGGYRRGGSSSGRSNQNRRRSSNRNEGQYGDNRRNDSRPRNDNRNDRRNDNRSQRTDSNKEHQKPLNPQQNTTPKPPISKPVVPKPPVQQNAPKSNQVPRKDETIKTED